MTNNPQGEFTPPESSSSTPAKNNNNNTALFIALGVGCGCLVLPVFVGILAAIALPSFLNQANRAKEAEATTYLGTMNRGQQAHYVEYGEFTPSLDVLDLGIPSESDFYRYQVIPDTDLTSTIYMIATPKEEGLAAMASAVFVIGEGGLADSTTILCRSSTLGATSPPLPEFDSTSGVAYCPEGSETR